jgi:hypothetical protein
MSRFFLKTKLSTGKDSIVDRIFDSKAEELAQEKGNGNIENTERFLDVVSNVKNEELQNNLRYIYLKQDEETGEECARLIEKYYKNGFADGVKLVVECVNGGNGK